MKYNKLYGPYSSKEDALIQLPIIDGKFNTKITERYIGLTIGIKNSNRNEDIDEYWFKDGIQDDNLVKKNIEDITELKLNNEQITDTTFTKYSEFNQLFDNGTIKLDKLPNDLRDINTTISNKINNSDELKDIINNSITNNDNLTDIVSNSINNNTIIQGLQGKFNDGKLDTLVSNLTDANGKFKLPDDVVLVDTLESKIPNTIVRRTELPANLDTVINNFTVKDGEVSLGASIKLPDSVVRRTELPDNLNTVISKFTVEDGEVSLGTSIKLPDDVVLNTTLESKLPDNIKAISNNFEYNNGNLTIKDGSVLTTTFTKQTDVNGLISEQVSGLLTEGNETFQNAVESAIGNGDVVNNAISRNTIIKGLQGKFDSDGKLVNTVLPTGLQQFTSKLSNDGKLATLDVLPTGVITTENIENNTIVKGLQSKFNADGKLKDDLISTTFAKQTDVDGLQTMVAKKADSSALTTLNSTVSGLQTTVAKKADSSALTTLNSTVSGLQGKFNADGKLKDELISTTFAKQTDVDGLQTIVANKADGSALTTLNSTVSGLQTTVAKKADSSALTTLNSTVSGLQGNVSTLQTTVASKADSSALTTLNSTVTTLQGKFNSSQIGPRNAGFVNIETDTTVTDYSDLVTTSINGARIPATMVQSSIAGTETGYYYFLCDSVDNIPSTDYYLSLNYNQ